MRAFVIVAALLLSAILLIMYAAYYMLEARRTLYATGVANPHVQYLGGTMIAVGIIEVCVAVWLLSRVAATATPPAE